MLVQRDRCERVIASRSSRAPGPCGRPCRHCTRLDPETLDDLDGPVELALNDIGLVTLRTSSVIVADTTDNRDNGAFILIDETSNDTVGAGTIAEAREVKPGAATRNDIRWHPSSLDRDYRWGKTGQTWCDHLVHRVCRPPANPPSRFAVERALVESGQVAYLLDGDNPAARPVRRSGSPPATGPRTSAGSGISPDCWPTPAWWHWLPWSRR